MGLRYNIRSRFLVDIVNDLKSRKLIIAPYFQRKLVWRLSHKIDFIKTILLGYPFPEIFLSRGRINLEDMTSTSSVVDGQQRLSAITQFIDNEFPVDRKFFKDLASHEKEAFFKYEIAIIDLDLPANDPIIIDIFNRLNRTFYALSTIEKQATEFASTEFMLTAKFLAGEVGKYSSGDSLEIDEDRTDNDPNMSEEFLNWCAATSIRPYHRWLLDSGTFSTYEISRQVHLSYTLLVMSTFLNGLFQRSDQVKTDLEKYANEFAARNELTRCIVFAADLIEKARPTPFWRRKANAFTLLVAANYALRNNKGLKPAELKGRLAAFSAAPPPDYLLAAKEGVNNRKERILRHQIVCRSVFEIEVTDDPKVIGVLGASGREEAGRN